MARGLNKSYIEIWNEHLSLYPLLTGGDVLIYPGLAYTPFCGFLDKEGACSIYNSRPEGCRLFPLSIDFKEPNFPCLIHPASDAMKDYEQKHWKNHLIRLNETAQFLLEEKHIQEPPEESVLLTQLMGSGEFYKKHNPNRVKHYAFLVYYLKNRGKHSNKTRASLDRLLIGEYYYQQFYSRVKNNLRKLEIEILK
jgi:Fe-S-cluster containining protein